MNKGKILLLVLVICCVVTFFFYNNLFSQFWCSKKSTYSITPPDAQKIIISVKGFIVKGFSKNNEHDKNFVEASEELSKNFADIMFARNNIFTIKNSSWLFFVKKDIAQGAYIGKKYIAFVVLKNNKGYWETQDGGIFKISGRSGTD